MKTYFTTIAVALICVSCSHQNPSAVEVPLEPEAQAIEIQATETSASEPASVKLESLIPQTRYKVAEPKSAENPEPASETPKVATETTEAAAGIRKATAETASSIVDLCREIGAKLGSVETSDCFRQNLEATTGKSVEGRDLAIKNYLPAETREPLGRVLVIGGIHGDEFSSVSVVFKWMDILNQHHSGLFHWRFIPAANPDGLLNKQSRRQNANGVDLNRNFPTADWNSLAKDYWINQAYKHPRRYPGEDANSEPETQWLVKQINEFQPDVIVSMHAPYHLVDYDGPPRAPDQLGSLYLRKLGVFPGSLGNYAGVDLSIPIVTVELASAGSMPSSAEISDMWGDLVSWLRTKLSE